MSVGEHGRVAIVHVYPTLLGLYGDRGNPLVLAHRARRYGYDAEIVDVAPGAAVPENGDLYFIGGAEDSAQTAAAELLVADGGVVRAARRGAVVFAVCAGFQLLGESFVAADREVPGLGLLDAVTDRLERRAVGEVSATVTPALHLAMLSGFENHGGRTTLGAGCRPLATVTHGVGNGTPDRAEGAVADRVLGTYLHGPVLARNPELADLLLGWAVGATLRGLDDDADVVADLRSERLEAARTRRAT